MNCFDNLIGIHRSCGTVTPASDLYIQDLRGINMQIANAGVDSETISGLKMIQGRISHAQNAIVAHVRNQFSSKIRVNSILQNDTVGHYKDNLRVVSAESGKRKGIRIKIDKHPHLEFFLSKIYLKLSQAVTTKVYIYDLMNNELLDELDITTEANVPTAILVNKSYQTNRQRLHLFIAIDSSVSDTYETSLINGDCSSCYGSDYSNKYVSFYGASIADSSQKIDANVRSNTGTNGLSFEYSLNCSVEPFICNLGKQLAWPLLHKAGAEIMKELIASKRHNSIINLDKATHEELRDEYEAEFMASMSGILNNLQLPDDICFRCDSKIRKVVSIP